MAGESMGGYLPNPLELPTKLLPGTIVEWDNEIISQPREGFVVQQQFFGRYSYFDKINRLMKLVANRSSDTPKMEAIPFHDRTLGTISTLLADRGLYYIDGKSIGNYRRFIADGNINIRSGTPSDKRGFADLSSGIYDHRMQKILSKLGVRTHTSLGVVVPKKNLVGNSIKPNEVATTEANSIIAQQIRAYPTPYRIEDLAKIKNMNFDSGKILNNALLVYSTETGNPVELNTQDPFIISSQIEKYLFWVTKCIGDSVGRMHANGFAHRYLHLGNVTVDGRIVDLDSVSSIADEGITNKWSTKINKDRLDMIHIARKLVYVMQSMYPKISRFQEPEFEAEILNNLQHHYKKHPRNKKLVELHRKEGWTERQVLHDLGKIITSIQQLHSK